MMKYLRESHLCCVKTRCMCRLSKEVGCASKAEKDWSNPGGSATLC